MTRPLEPETADSVTDSAEESQAGAALGSQESAGVNAEQRHLTTSHGNSKLKLQAAHSGFTAAKLSPRPGNGPQDLSGRKKQQTGSQISGEREVGSPARRGP
ncbi:USP6 N-terminal-like protein [Dissostichus eleginoides]|uniref:USP6 N-terminal-like protein n=1 Tax=Dissostichus eleginoides TaxID=100907 RepID=A0AAD9C156_DISEL|nr:USP6 N-terminal-like protein [Dissostichus eleginoides]